RIGVAHAARGHATGCAGGRVHARGLGGLMPFVAAYAFAFVACALLARRQRKALVMWSQTRPAPGGPFRLALGVVTLAATIACTATVPGYDIWMALIAAACASMLAAFSLTALLGFVPQLVPRAAIAA